MLRSHPVSQSVVYVCWLFVPYLSLLVGILRAWGFADRYAWRSGSEGSPNGCDARVWVRCQAAHQSVRTGRCPVWSLCLGGPGLWRSTAEGIVRRGMWPSTASVLFAHRSHVVPTYRSVGSRFCNSGWTSPCELGPPRGLPFRGVWNGSVRMRCGGGSDV